MRRAVNHFRSNVVGYLALFVALGGTSYAALRLPANSVGNRQIRNHSIDPDKFNPRYIKGNVRLWASVNAAGKVVGGGRGAVVRPQGSVPGDYLVSPSSRSGIASPRRCAAIASVDDSSAVPGIAEAQVSTFPKPESPRWQVVVQTFDAHGHDISLPFDLAVIC